MKTPGVFKKFVESEYHEKLYMIHFVLNTNEHILLFYFFPLELFELSS